MKNMLSYFIIFCVFTSVNAQKTSDDFFYYKEKKLTYGTINFIGNSNTFNVMIFESFNIDNVLDKIKSCNENSDNIGSIYYIIIPIEYNAEKDELVLEFLSDIFSKKKLVNKEMNIIADGNYFSLYEEKIAHTRRYKKGLLNKIEKLNIIKTKENMCDFIK